MKSSLRSIVSLVAVVLSVPALGTAAPPSGRVAIMNAKSGLCLSPAGGGRQLNGEIVQFTCDQDPSRFWSFTVINDEIVEITNLHAGLCLTIGAATPSETSFRFSTLATVIRRAGGVIPLWTLRRSGS